MNADQFWRASSALYARSPVRDKCLELQEGPAACNVNLLLLACCAGLQNREIEPPVWAALAQAIDAWQLKIIRPLRSVRRRAKGECRELYEQLKAAELLAERHEQRFIVKALPQISVSEDSNCVERNLLAYGGLCSPQLERVVEAKLVELARAVRSR